MGYNKKIYFINNGIKVDINFKNELKTYSNKNKFTLINIGSMNSVHGLKVKGHELLIKAIALLPKNLLKNTELMLLGDGTHINFYKSLAHDLKIDKKIKFKGLVSDVKQYLIKSDIAIFPSLFEGLPLAAIEASIVGLPLITSDITAFDIFDNNCNLRFEKNNVKGLTNKIIYALENLESLKNYSIKSISNYRKMFSIKNTAKEYHNIYSRTI
tara:strand:- start:1594 stop:2232 length:639 start_codon:yes stop_codon:yes gene_type:complete